MYGDTEWTQTKKLCYGIPLVENGRYIHNIGHSLSNYVQYGEDVQKILSGTIWLLNGAEMLADEELGVSRGQKGRQVEDRTEVLLILDNRTPSNPHGNPYKDKNGKGVFYGY